MGNINVILAENIQRYRKEQQMTQKELAEKLGITYQAVSKWENASSAPDISFLPVLADVFACAIDDLFSRDVMRGGVIQVGAHCSSLPWNDDDVIRGVVCVGRKILTVKNDLVDKFTFEIVGGTKAVKSECNITVTGSVKGGCHAKNSINIGHSANGGIFCGNSVSIGAGHTGAINCGAAVSCNGNINGSINCGAGVVCNNVKANTIRCGSTIYTNGDVRAKTVRIRIGEIKCNTLKCDKLRGNVKVKTNE